jgi:TPR repeat protein
MNQAVAIDPRAYGPRSLYLGTLRPEWGGSLRLMELAINGWKGTLDEARILRLSRMLEDAKWRSELAPAARLVEEKRYKEALTMYDQALAKAPVARAYSMRGYSYAQLGQHEKAIEDYNRSLEIDPDSNCGCKTISSRAYSYLKLGALDKALRDLRVAADDDDAWATRELAVMYLTGRYGMQQDYVAARRWCERSAKQGDGMSMYCMGGLLDKGLGGPKDERTAVQWYEGAANRGVPDAQADFAHMLWHGQRVTQDRDRAIKYWRAAAQKGNKRAAAQLESNLSGWEHFSKVSVPGWIAEQRQSSPWMYLVLSSLGLDGD